MRQRKEISVDLLGIGGLDPFFATSSSPRKAMFATHVAQAPIVKGNVPRRIFTGVESEYGRFTFDVKFPCDATIIKVIPKFHMSGGRDGIAENPLVTIIYEDYYDPNKTIGVLQVPAYRSFHQEFGFEMDRRQDTWGRLTTGQTFAKGEVLATSPAVRENGQYGYGLQAEVAYMSTPPTIEDGIQMSDEWLQKATATGSNKLAGNWGKKMFPLNLYGDDEHYKPFPDIGDRIRSDGLVMALREIDPLLSPAEMTPRALRTVDFSFDRPLWGKANAKVVDIDVYHDDRLEPSPTPTGMEEQASKYYEALKHYHQSLLDEYDRLAKKRGRRLRVTPEFGRLLRDAKMFLPTPMNERKLTRMYRLEILDEWRVEVTYKYDMEADVGFKFTDCFGGLI